MVSFLGYFMLVASLTSSTLAQQQNPQLAPQSAQQASNGRSSPLGVRYSASTDVSHVSFNSPLVSYGDSLSKIQLPAAPIQPATTRQAGDQESERGNVPRASSKGSGDEPQDQPQRQSEDPQQFISVQHYPARPQVQLAMPQGFSLRQNLPGAQQPLQQTSVRYAPQYTNQIQPQQNSIPQIPQQQPQYTNPAYSTPSVNTYLATGHFAGQNNKQLPTLAPQYPQAVSPQYAQPQYPQAVSPQYAQPQYPQAVASQYPQTFASQYPQYPQTFASQYPQPQYPETLSSQYPQPQYPQTVPSQFPQPEYSQTVPSQFPQAQYPQIVPSQYPQAQYPQILPSQYPQSVDPQYSQSVPVPNTQARAQLISRVTFNGPLSSFSYGF